MLEVGNMVKVIGTTNSGGVEKECIPIGTICEVTDVESYTKRNKEGYLETEIIYEVTPTDRIGTAYWYYEKDLEKGKLAWIKE